MTQRLCPFFKEYYCTIISKQKIDFWNINKLICCLLKRASLSLRGRQEMHMLVSGAASKPWLPGPRVQIGHWAHVAGAAMGVLVVLGLSRLPRGADSPRS